MERGVYSENQTQPELSLGMVLNLLRIKNKGFCLYNKHTPIKVCIVYIKKMLPFYPVLLWKLRWSTYDTETKIVHINFERIKVIYQFLLFVTFQQMASVVSCVRLSTEETKAVRTLSITRGNSTAPIARRAGTGG